jgi:hypothetical protein
MVGSFALPAKRLRQLQSNGFSGENSQRERPGLSAGGPEMPKSRQARGDMGGASETATLGDRTAQVREEARRFPNSSGVWKRAAIGRRTQSPARSGPISRPGPILSLLFLAAT